LQIITKLLYIIELIRTPSAAGNALFDLFRDLIADIGQLDQLGVQGSIMLCKFRPFAKLTGAFAPELGVDHDETLVECDGFAA
jgi:hypothetical protein